jgi:hypothetical protein
LKDKLELLVLELETILQTEGFETEDSLVDLAGVREMLEKQYKPIGTNISLKQNFLSGL